MIKYNSQKNKGFALLLALIISSIALSIGLSMLHVTLKQLSLGTTTKGSEIAFQSASAGMECLRYIRSNQASEIFAGDSVSLECLGKTTTMTRVIRNASHRVYTAEEIEWGPSGETLCVGIEMHLIDASAASNPIGYDFGSGGSKTCQVGDVCTFGFVRGYNRSCEDVSGSSIFIVQRELTVEF